MSLYDAIRAELPGLRLEAEARMTSWGTIRHRTGETVPDPNDPEAQIDEWVVIADCPGRLAARGASGTRNATIGGAEVSLAVREWHMPTWAAAPSDGDLIEVTAGEHAGLVLRVVEATGQDQATARRLPVVEARREWA